MNLYALNLEAELDMKANSKALREKSKSSGNDIVKSSEET